VELLMFRLGRMALMAVLTASALVLGGAVVTSTEARAGSSTGTWRNGMQAGPGGVGCYNQGCAARNYARPAPSYRRSGEYRMNRRYHRSSDYGMDRGYRRHRGYESYRGRESYGRDRY
jgi:hypothetical protein